MAKERNPDFDIVLAINRHVSQVKQATTQLHGKGADSRGPAALPSITPVECAERIIESAMALQETVNAIQEGGNG